MNREKEELFIEIINEYKRMIYTVCYMFSNSTDDVDDLYQEILVKLWNGFNSFEGKSNIKTWIYRVSLNYCINFSNHQKKEREYLDSFSNTDNRADEKGMDKDLQLKQLYKRINSLGLVDRSVILLWLEGLYGQFPG